MSTEQESKDDLSLDLLNSEQDVLDFVWELNEKTISVPLKENLVFEFSGVTPNPIHIRLPSAHRFNSPNVENPGGWTPPIDTSRVKLVSIRLNLGPIIDALKEYFNK